MLFFIDDYLVEVSPDNAAAKRSRFDDSAAAFNQMEVAEELKTNGGEQLQSLRREKRRLAMLRIEQRRLEIALGNQIEPNNVQGTVGI